MADLEIKTIGQALRTTGLFNNWPKIVGHCDIHGDFESVKYPGKEEFSTCNTCYQIAEKKRGEEQWEERRREARAQEHMRLVASATIPPRFAAKTLEDFVAHTEGAKRALALSRAYVEDFEENAKAGSSLIFCGGVGTGKTHLAIGIANALLNQEKRVRFVSVMNAVREVKETYSRNSEHSERDVIDNFTHPDLLVLDEVGVQFGSETEKLILFEIINGRYEQIKPTLVISNLAKDSLGEFIGERSIDRLRENGGRLVVFDWASYRRQAS